MNPPSSPPTLLPPSRPTATRPPSINVTITSTMRTTNGVEVTLDARLIRLHKPGPNGGSGVSLDIPISDWELLNSAVVQVREAIKRANTLLEEIRQP